MSHLSTEETAFLKDKAKQIRIDILKMITKANSGHTGGSLSIADLLTLLYFKEMNVDPANPHKEDRDRLVLSKGHAAPAMYACLAEKGYFPKDELNHLRQAGHMLQGHPDMKHTPGVDMTTGSLGQGISAACGMALASKMDHADWRVYAVLGDGELEEGQVWEAAMCAGFYKEDHLIGFVDNNKLQLDGALTDVMSPYPIDEKFKAFGWNVIMIDGNDVEQIYDAVESAKALKGKPTMIVAETVKGKGVSVFENQVRFHGSYPTADEFKTAYSELDTRIAELEEK